MIAPEAQITASRAVLERLARERRHVLSTWRASVLLRRATRELPETQRRWKLAPAGPWDVQPLLRQMERRGEIARLGLSGRQNDSGSLSRDERLPDSGLYEVTVPYADTGPVDEREIVMEIHPYASLAYLSALVFHGLTDQLPKATILIVPSDGRGEQLPSGTELSDWDGATLVSGVRITSVFGQPIEWHRLGSGRYFGTAEYRPRGYPIRVTTPERTLVDGLREPERSGGIENVLRAWILGRDLLDVDQVIDCTERFNIAVLRQRVGYLLETLGFHHPALERWQKQARRGGSSKLLGSAPYAPVYSESWNLSLNASIAALDDVVR